MKVDDRYLRITLRMALILLLLSALVPSGASAAPVLLDPSFDGDGKVTTLFGTEVDVAHAVAVQPDGKIVAVGYYRSGNDFDFAIARYNSDGSLDTTFGAHGRRSADFFGFFDFGQAVAIQPDGKIVVAGFTSNGSNNDFALVRYHSNGSADTSFSADGKVTTDFGGFFGTEDIANAVAVQPDGKIVVVGQSSQIGPAATFSFAVARYNSDGSPDAGFGGGDGELITGFPTAADDIGYAVAIQPDGKIVVAGSTETSGNPDFALLRVNSDGTADTTFNGIVTTDFFAGSSDAAYAVALQPDGKIVLAGTSGPGWSDFAVARYNSDGSPDTNFAGDGATTTDFNRSLDIGRAVAIQPDGRIIVAGSSQASFGGFPIDFAVARYTSNGWEDPIFDGDGRVTVSIGTDDYGYGVALQPDGKIVVAGSTNNGSSTDFGLVRFLADWDGYEPDNSPVEATEIASGVPQTHDITPPTDVDWVKFSLPAASAVILETSGMTGADTEMSLVTGSDLVNPYGYNNDKDAAAGDLYSYLAYSCSVNPLPAGTYYVKVNEFQRDSEIPDYQLSLTVTGCPTAATLADVPVNYWAWSFVEQLYAAGITGGCATSPLRYCPEDTVTRAQMGVFLLRGIHTSSYTPPAVGSATGFGDVPTDYWAGAFIKQLAAEGITSGCGGGNYCPEQAVTRAQMAVFLLRSKYGASYVPPAVGSSTGFGDVPPDYWAAAWIKQLVTEGITAGCGNGNYCPESPVTRAQMAVFLVRTFSLP